jgi:hypothetical protein
LLYAARGRNHVPSRDGHHRKKSLKAVLAEFRKGIAYRRAQGVSEQRIRQYLGEAIWLVTQEVKDPELQTWLCVEFRKAVRVAPILTIHPASRTLH